MKMAESFILASFISILVILVDNHFDMKECERTGGEMVNAICIVKVTSNKSTYSTARYENNYTKN